MFCKQRRYQTNRYAAGRDKNCRESQADAQANPLTDELEHTDRMNHSTTAVENGELPRMFTARVAGTPA